MFQLITYTLQYKIIICSIEKKLCVRISVCMHKNWSEVVKVYGSPHLSSIKELVIHKLCNIMTWLPPNNVLLPYSYLKAVTSQTSYGLSIGVEWDKPMKTFNHNYHNKFEHIFRFVFKRVFIFFRSLMKSTLTQVIQ